MGSLALGTLTVLFLALMLLPIGSPNTFGQTGQGLERDGRWFTYNGQYIFLIGYDSQELAADTSLDYNAALDLFVKYRLNKVRIWIGYCYFDPRFLAPWPVVNGKFDLDSWDPAFWQRVKDFVAAAQSRNIMVEATIIAPNNIDDTSWWSSAAWNRANNRNGVFTTNALGMFSPEFWDLTHAEVSTSGKRLVDYQEALVNKTVLELGTFPNLYMEIANEFPVNNANVDVVYPWQLAMAQRIGVSTPRLVTAHAHEYVGDHTKGVQYYWDQPYIDVLGFHFRTRDPGTISNLLHTVQTHGKVIQQNEGGDPYLELPAATQAAWGWVLSGGHYAMYEDDSSRIGSAGWRSGAQRLKVLHDIIDTVNWWQMSPVDAAGNEYDALITQGPSGSNRQVFANTGVHYLAYFWGIQRRHSVSISVPSGTYNYSWYDPRDGALLMSGSASPRRTGPMSISSPSPSTWDAAAGLVLVIKIYRPDPGGSPTFGDVPAGYWAYEWIDALARARVTSGCAAVSPAYCPEAPVTRAEMAIFVLKAKEGAAVRAPQPVGRFVDVPAAHWAAAWIEQLAADGITGGCGESRYCPDAPISRAEMAVFLAKAKHGTAFTPAPAVGRFLDVPVAHWAAAWIEQLAADGITGGCGESRYCPEAPVTRAQMAVFLVEAFGLSLE